MDSRGKKKKKFNFCEKRDCAIKSIKEYQYLFINLINYFYFLYFLIIFLNLFNYFFYN